MEIESYNPNNLAHQEPVRPISEWQEWNDLVGEGYWGGGEIPSPYIYFLLDRDEKQDTIWKYINKYEKS